MEPVINIVPNLLKLFLESKMGLSKNFVHFYIKIADANKQPKSVKTKPIQYKKR